MVKNPPSNAGDMGLILGWGAKNPSMLQGNSTLALQLKKPARHSEDAVQPKSKGKRKKTKERKEKSDSQESKKCSISEARGLHRRGSFAGGCRMSHMQRGPSKDKFSKAKP